MAVTGNRRADENVAHTRYAASTIADLVLLSVARSGGQKAGHTQRAATHKYSSYEVAIGWLLCQSATPKLCKLYGECLFYGMAGGPCVYVRF